MIDAIEETTPAVRLQRNMDAVRLALELREQNREATLEEQKKLALYTGWGALKNVFADYSPTKAFREAKVELAATLTEGEMQALAQSSQYAHFTSFEIVQKMWEMASKLGFKGGNVLEPSIGVGNFITGRPADQDGTLNVVGTDLEPISALIASKLLPGSNVENVEFQELNVRDNTMDLAIGNPPFSEVAIYDWNDRRYNHVKPALHDYFMLKSLDRVRQGGLLMFITSTGTMDKGDPRARQMLAEKADLVAAIRLPSGAFKKNAGTEVVSDLVILRKRYTTDPVPQNPEWMEVGTVPDPDGGEPITVNQYFINHPEQILGRLDRSGTMYAGDMKNVTRTDDFPELLQAAIDRLPQDIVASEAPIKIERSQSRNNATFGKLRNTNGKIEVFNGADWVDAQLEGPPLRKTIKLLEIRDVRDQLVQFQLTDAPEEVKQETRKTLGRIYDSYVSQFGYLNQPGNMALLDNDDSQFSVLGLEKNIVYKKNVNGARTGYVESAEKNDIFFKDTINPARKIVNTGDIGDGFISILSETGKVDLDAIASLTGKPKDEVEKFIRDNELAYEDPGAAGEWIDKTKYLSGNVRKKLKEASAAAKKNERYVVNALALEKVLPEDKPAHKIEVRVGSAWISPKDYAQFGADILQTEPAAFKIKHIDHSGKWLVDTGPSRYNWAHTGAASTDEWGTSRMAFYEILDRMMNSKPMTVYDTVQGKRVVNERETAAVWQRVRKIERKFVEWIWENDERRTRLHRHYNDTMNNIVRAKYDGSHLALPGKNPDITLREHQLNAVWRIVQDGRALLAHEVGTGKTYTMIAAAMEMKRLGLANKPVLGVLKSTFPGFLADIRKLYPGAKVLALDAKQWNAKNRKRFQAQLAQGDWDLVVMTHEVLSRIPVKPETEKLFFEEQIAELEAVIREVSIGANKKDPTVRELNKALDRLRNKLKKLLDTKKDNAVFFEETGIDFMFVDEAHYFKNLPFYSTRTGVKGIGSGKDSQRAMNMYMRGQYLYRVNKNRGLVFATGTPIDNSMAELWTMERFLQPDVLEERGHRAFDSWISDHGMIRTETAVTVGGTYVDRSTLVKFLNAEEMMQAATQTIDLQFAEDMEYIIRPKREEIIVETELGPLQRQYRDAIYATFRGLSGRDKFSRIGQLITMMRKLTMDVRMVTPRGAGENDPERRAAVVARSVLSDLKEFPGTTQMVFTDLFRANQEEPEDDTGEDDFDGDAANDDPDDDAAADDAPKEPPLPDYNFVDDLIDELVRGGIPREKIIDFSNLKGEEKTKAAQMLHEGTAWIGIGSTQRAGTGINAQGKMKAIHHADVPWKPAYIEQRDGRGWRQGNENESIRIYRYITKGSADQLLWGIVARKARAINDALRGNFASRVGEEGDEVVTFEELEAASNDNQLALERIELRTIKFELESGAEAHNSMIIKLRDSRLQNGIRLKQADQELAAVDLFTKQVKDTEEVPFTMEVDGKEQKTLEDGGKALLAAVEPHQYSMGKSVKLGTIRGIDLYSGYMKIVFKIGDVQVDSIDLRPGIDLALSFRSRFHPKRLAELRKRSVERIEQIMKNIKSSEKMLDNPLFPEQAVLEMATFLLADIEARLVKGEKNKTGYVAQVRQALEDGIKVPPPKPMSPLYQTHLPVEDPQPKKRRFSPYRRHHSWNGRAKAFEPTGTTISVSGVAYDPKAKPISEHAIIATMEREFDVPMAIGRVRVRKAAGIYMPHYEAIRFKPRWAGDLGVATHEVAHHIDEKSDVLKNLTPAMEAELKALDYDPVAQRDYEGFAEFIRHLLTEDDAIAAAPEFYKWFTQDWLKKPENQHYEQKLEKARLLIDLWRIQSPDQRVAANISKTGKPEKPIGVPVITQVREAVKESTLRMYAQWKDEGFYLSQFEKEAVDRGLSLKPGDRPYQLYMAYNQAGPTMAYTALIEKGVFNITGNGNVIGPSLSDVLKNITSEEYEAWVRYVYARHAIESHMKGKDPGIRYDDAKAVEALGSTKAHWVEAANLLTDLNNALIEMMGDAGVLTPKEVRDITKFYDTYIPLMRVRPKRLSPGKGLSARRLVDLGASVKGRKGARLQIVDPVTATVERAVRFYTRASQQQVIQSMVNTSRGAKGLGGWMQQVPPGTKKTTIGIEDIRDQLEDLGVDPVELDVVPPDALLFMYRPDYTIKNGEPVVRVELHGKPTLWELDPDLYRAVRGMNKVQIPFFLDIVFGVPARLTRLGATGLNPDFATANLIRDYATFIFQTKEAPDLRGAGMIPQMIGSYIWSEVQRTRGLAGDPIVELWQEMGGELSTKIGLDRDELRGVVRDAMRSETTRRAIRAATNPVDAMRKVVNVTEVGPRLTEFRAALERRGYDKDKIAELRSKGMQPPRDVLIEAINAANDVTVNFRRMGYYGKYANTMIPFFNAQLEGPDKMVRTLRDQSTRKRAIIRLAIMAAMTAAYWYYRKDDDDYQEQESWLKYGFWTFADKDGKTFVRIPRPFDYGWIVASNVEAILNAIYERDPAEMKKYLKAMVHRLAPDVLPNIVMTSFETFANYDTFRNRDIVSDELLKLKPEDQYTPQTTELMKAIGKETGISPARIEHLVNQTTGGLYRRTARGVDVATGQRKGEIADIPGLGGLMLRSESSKSVDQFYDELKRAEQERNSARKNGETSKEITDRYDLLNEYAEIMRDIRKMIPENSTRDERFVYERFIIGLARDAMGQADVDRYPSPLERLPDDASNEIKAMRAKVLGQWLFQSTTPEPQRQKDESDRAFHERRQAWRASTRRARLWLGRSEIGEMNRRRLLEKETVRRGFRTDTPSFERRMEALSGR